MPTTNKCQADFAYAPEPCPNEANAMHDGTPVCDVCLSELEE